MSVDSLQICMRKAGMDEESSYDHGKGPTFE